MAPNRSLLIRYSMTSMQPRRGYGIACQTGLTALQVCDIVVFLDGDYSDYPGEMSRLVDPILEGLAELVIGSRVAGNAQPGALTLQQRFGNRLACGLMASFLATRARRVYHRQCVASTSDGDGWGCPPNKTP